jgi:phosphatidylinositol alpha-1,6-mannosyltransferase
MIRVLVLTPDFPPAPGGIQLVMSRLVTNLNDAEVRVVTLGFEDDAPRSSNGVDVVAAGRNRRSGNKLANARLNVTGVIAGLRFRPDAIVSGHAVTAPAAALVKRVTGAPVLQYLHADEARHRPRLLRFAMTRADAVAAVSDHARRLAEDAGCKPERVHVIHPGVDQPEYPPNGARSDQPTIVTVARMQAAYKGHDTMIRALTAIRARVPDVRWVAIGDGRLRPELERLAQTLGVRDAIEFTGRVSDADRDQWLDSAHVFAMPSRLPPGGRGGEGFGIVYLEAGSRGLPVVAGDVGGAVDAVASGDTGLLVDPEDHSAVAEAIVELLLDPDRARRLGESGARRAAAFTWERHAAAVEGLIHEMTRDGR